jgi:hypothetical protein
MDEDDKALLVKERNDENEEGEQKPLNGENGTYSSAHTPNHSSSHVESTPL